MGALWIPIIGIPLLIFVTGVLLWINMQKEEREKAARRAERKLRYKEVESHGAQPGDVIKEQIELGDIQGRWKMVSVGRNGAFAPSEIVEESSVTLTIVGSEFMIDPSGEFGRIEIDSSQNPVHLDQLEHGSDSHSCIVRIRNDELEICQAEDGAARPTDFNPLRSDNASLTRFKQIEHGRKFAIRRAPTTDR